MRRTLRLAAAAAALFLVLQVGTVQATPALDVSFDVQTSNIENPLGSGPFTSSGPAVEAGLVCATGDTVGVDGAAVGYESGRGLNATVVKQFSCGDGSGAFWIKLQVRVDARGSNFVWVIVDGTGDYARLRGTGSGTGLPIGDFVIDHYDGVLHVD